MTKRAHIPGLPGYTVTNSGDVFGPQGIRKLWRRPDGYLSFNTSKGTFLVHQRVLLAFVGPRPDGCDACHNNGVRQDNRLANLRWDSRSGNHADMAKHGTARRGESHERAILTERDVVEIRRLAATGTKQRDIAAQFNIHWKHVSLIVLRKRWKHI